MKASDMLSFLQGAIKKHGDLDVFIGNNFASTSWAEIQEYWEIEGVVATPKNGVFIYFDPETQDKTEMKGGER